MYISAFAWPLQTGLGTLQLRNVIQIALFFLHELFQFQEGLALKVYAIHVLNAPSIGQQILSFFKKFMKPKILDRLVLHSNLEELHKALPKECLPRDYGGEDYSMDELKGEPKELFDSE